MFLKIPLTRTLTVESFAPNDIKLTIQKYSLNKAPGYVLITAEVAR